MSIRKIETPLVSNGYPLTRSEQGISWLVPSDPSRPLEALREQYREQGYLWLRGILNRERVLAFRRRFFEAYASTGLLAEGTDPSAGIFAGNFVSHEVRQRLLMEIVRWPEYEAFCLAPEIIGFYEKFFGGKVHLLKRKIIRYTAPGDKNCTPGHYDLIYLRAGSDSVCSSWIPLGDIPVEMGGLAYLEHSDALGRKMEAEFTAKNATLSPEERISAYNKNMSAGGWVGKDLAALADLIQGRWLLADYAAGDMVVHSPYMIHGSTENHDPLQRMRLSTDIRYQLQGDKIDPRWNHDHFVGDNL
ncbi:MAG TPA: phytanoyl-CoA dioxygenase family protein [Ktedonobacteraceae bacterium]|jgi:ectoine hydroxylase-related dioxygenase (phytanoyl-CoA dioxygenase family)|nr:phytanoyl-CoA dioxygenase family protein [Ktedonobacteraceae bacterium]